MAWSRGRAGRPGRPWPARSSAPPTDPTTPLRVPVGGDTDLILAARTGQTFEDYEVTMRTFLDYWEGYRGRAPSDAAWRR